MALGRDRTPQSLQGFDPDFFGGGCSDGHLSSLLDHWAYPSTSSVLSFEQGDGPSGGATYPNLRQEEGCGASWINTVGCCDPTDSRQGEDQYFRLLYPSVSGAADCLQEGGQTERGQKRPYLENRRERISERLKVLQELVPNGTKVQATGTDNLSVDLVTMLEKAISYVKFLQLQVKVLATDEFWPAQGGKAPEAAQVKEAIDAILSSHRGKN